MKKTIIFFLIIVLSSKGLFSQFLPFYNDKKNTNALQMMDLKGKVKSVEQKAFVVKDSAGIISRGENKNEISLSVNSDFLMQFDTKGRSIKEMYFKKHIVEITHSYDSIKNTETIEEHTAGKVWMRYVYKYNISGKLIQIESSQFFKDNSPSYNTKSFYKYDPKGNMIESNHYSPKETLPVNTFCKYDDKGNLISIEWGRKDAYNGKETFKIDGKGNIGEHIYFAPDCKTVDHAFVYKYDTNKNVVQKDYYKPEGKLVKKHTYTYEYDKIGNWTKRIDSENGKAVLIVERKLEYY